MGKKEKIELECACGCSRIAFDLDEDGILFVSIAERKRGRPKWHEVVLYEDKVKKILNLFKPKKKEEVSRG